MSRFFPDPAKTSNLVTKSLNEQSYNERQELSQHTQQAQRCNIREELHCSSFLML